MNKQSFAPLFPLGRIMATPGALALLDRTASHPVDLLCRHQRGDWGLVGAEDAASNDRAVVLGERILSAYALGAAEEKVWLITEADRSVSTILLPAEY